MGGLYSRIKTWVSTEDVVFSDLNAEFDNVLTNFVPLMMDDYSTNVSQMQVTTDPGEVGSESLATTLAGELARLRHIIKEITGEDQWHESPIASLLGLSNAIGGGLTPNRLVSGRVRSGSQMPTFLVPNGAARTVKLDGTPTAFVYYVAGTQYSITTDVTITGLTAAPSSNNTCLIDDTIATADEEFTKFTGENGTEIPVDTMGSEISALVGKFAAFKLAGASTEYFIAYVDSTTRLTRARRGYFFDSTDAPVPRTGYTNNDTITLMKLTWIYAKTDGTLHAVYTNPTYGKDEPSSPATGDYWYDTDNQVWKVYSGVAFAAAGATLVGCCFQDTTNTVGARSFEFFAAYEENNTFEIIAESNSQVKSRWPGAQANVWGSTVRYDQNNATWDMTLDLDSGVTESASTYYYFYLTEEGDKIISNIRPYDRSEDLHGWYHPHQSWRCLGLAFNDGSSNLTAVESYFNRYPQSPILPSQTAASRIEVVDRVVPISTSGGAVTKTLPPAAFWRGQTITVVKTSTSDANAITVDGYASETIHGATTYLIYAPYESATFFSDGTNIIVINRFQPIPDCELFLHTGNGHGSGSTKIMKFTTVAKDTASPYFTYINDGTLGTVVTIAIPGLYHYELAGSDSGSTETYGITVNEGATLTTNMSTPLTYAQGVRIRGYHTTAQEDQNSGTIRHAVGDVVRPHDDGASNDTTERTYFKVMLIGR